MDHNIQSNKMFQKQGSQDRIIQSSALADKSVPSTWYHCLKFRHISA